MRCVVYTRVSHHNQSEAEGGKSLAMQLEKAKSWAELHDATVVAVFTDEAVSAKSINGRKEFQKALETVYSDKADALLVYSLSRGFRSTQDCLSVCEELNKRGKALVSITESIQSDNAMGKFFLTLLASLATLERELLGERVQAVMDSKRGRGERLGAIPYGSKLSQDGIHLEELPEEQIVIKCIRGYAKKGMSMREIAKKLNEKNILTKEGKAWTHRQIGRILQA
jgi:site-specific DNA recombinase